MSVKYRYSAADASGKVARGRLLGTDEHDVFRRLAAQGLRPIKIAPAPQLVSVGSRGRRIPHAAIAGMTRELSVLVEARIPLAQGLGAMAANEKHPGLAGMIGDIAGRIEAGERVSDAIAQHEEVLGEVYVATMRAAEATGKLAEVTEHLADMLEAEAGMRQRLRRAATYPVIVLSIVGVALSVILGFVVPRFAKTYASAGVDLPLATRVVQAVGASMQHWWWLYLGVIIAVTVVLRQMWSTPKGRLRIERWLVRVPYVSRLLTAVSTARFCRVLTIASGAGIGLTDAIEVSASASGSARVKEEAGRLTGRIRGGASLGEVMGESGTIPPFARRLLAASKETREVSKSSEIIARHFERESRHLSASMSSVVEPVMTILLAFIVLVVALSVFLPMWKLIGVNH
jgi:type II secretory pathway component PulF